MEYVKGNKVSQIKKTESTPKIFIRADLFSKHNNTQTGSVGGATQLK